MSIKILLASIIILCHDAVMAESYASQFARKGGQARARKLTPKQRKEIASGAAQARWKKVKESKAK
jgi:hypothetical protein